MTTPTPTLESDIRSVDSSIFAGEWLHRSPERAIRTVPVIAVVQELLTVLRDEHMPPHDAYIAFRRAVRILSVFAVDTGKRHGRDEGQFHLSEHVPTEEDLARSTASARFATAALRGSPHEAIRTEPVIAVVQDLLDTLLSEYVRAWEAHLAFRRAVRLLSAFTTNNRHEQPHDPNQ
jgi:hypothetical protein